MTTATGAPTPPAGTTVIAAYRPRQVPEEVAVFARELVARCGPLSATRAKSLLYATSRLGLFCSSVGLPLSVARCLSPAVIERFILEVAARSTPTMCRTLRANLRFVASAHASVSPPPWLSIARDRAKAPYGVEQIAAYLALANTLSTESRRRRADALICCGAGAGLVGGDLRALRGGDVVCSGGGIVIVVRTGHHPRRVPVLVDYHERLMQAASFAGESYLLGGRSSVRRNVTTAITALLSDGRDLPRIDGARLRATWLFACAERLGLAAFMAAAGINCSQRLGDLLGDVPPANDTVAVALLGGKP